VNIGNNGVLHNLVLCVRCCSVCTVSGSRGATSSVRYSVTWTCPGRAPRNFRTCFAGVYSTSTAVLCRPLL
jgi:hypothetical protein